MFLLARRPFDAAPTLARELLLPSNAPLTCHPEFLYTHTHTQSLGRFDSSGVAAAISFFFFFLRRRRDLLSLSLVFLPAKKEGTKLLSGREP